MRTLFGVQVRSRHSIESIKCRCTESVDWIVFTDYFELSADQLTQFDAYVQQGMQNICSLTWLAWSIAI
jgi:hypothetical protein